MLSLKTFNFYYKIVYAFYLNTNCSVLIPVDYWSSVLILTLLSWCRSHRLRAQSYLRLSPLQTSVWSSWDSQDASVQFISVQSFSHVRLFATPWTAAHQASLSITNSQSLLKLMSIKLVMPSNHLILCHLLLLSPLIFPSIRVFSNESVLHIRWPKYWSFNFSISPSNGYSGLISLRMDWLDLLAVQGTLKSLLQHHSSKASILRRSAFFIVQFSHPYMTTRKIIALTRWTFFGKVMSLLFNMLSRLVITFFSNEQASFNFMAAVIICSDFGVPQNKVCHYFHCFPIYLPWSDGTRCHDLSFLNVEF